MRALIIVFSLGILTMLVAPGAVAATHQVDVRNFDFVPSSLTIQAGDSVHWTWVEGSHTVTSGNDSADPNVGDLFDVSVNSGNPEFGYRFNQAGQYPYFCRPHEALGMKGMITVETPLGVFDTDNAVPNQFSLAQNYPNPFNPQTVVSFSLQTDGPTTLTVFNILGQHVATVVDQVLPAGSYRVIWDSRDASGTLVPSGMYFYRLQSADRISTRKMVVMR